MWPDRVSNPGPDLRVRCPTDCPTRPGNCQININIWLWQTTLISKMDPNPSLTVVIYFSQVQRDVIISLCIPTQT